MITIAEMMGGVGESPNAVRWTIVESTEWRAIFDKLADNTSVNSLAHSEALQMLRHRNNTSFEDISIIGRVSKAVIGRSTKAAIAGEVRYTENLKNRIASATKNGDVLIAIHNHPKGFPPSLSDILSMKNRNYSKSIIVGHDGTVFVIDRVDSSFAEYHFNEIYKGYLNSGKSDADAAILTLGKLKNRGLISWRKL